MRVLCLLVALLLAGCGQKGPLYFPEPQPAHDSAQAGQGSTDQPPRSAGKPATHARDNHSDRS